MCVLGLHGRRLAQPSDPAKVQVCTPRLKKTVQNYYLSELCQIFANCENFWHIVLKILSSARTRASSARTCQLSSRDLHGDRNHTPPHPSPQTLFPSPPIPIHFHFHPRPSPHNFISIPVRPCQYLFHPHSIPVPELTAGNRSNINSDAMKEISINYNMDCIPLVYYVLLYDHGHIDAGLST